MEEKVIKSIEDVKDLIRGLTLLGAKADSKYRRPEGIALLGPRYFGFDVEYIFIEKQISRKTIP